MGSFFFEYIQSANLLYGFVTPAKAGEEAVLNLFEFLESRLRHNDIGEQRPVLSTSSGLLAAYEGHLAPVCEPLDSGYTIERCARYALGFDRGLLRYEGSLVY